MSMFGKSEQLGNQYFLSDQYMMLQNQAWWKDVFKVQDRPKDFSVIRPQKVKKKENKKTTRNPLRQFQVLLRLTCKTLPLVKFCFSFKKKVPQLSSEPIKTCFLFPAITEWGCISFRNVNEKRHIGNRVNPEADVSIQLFSVKPDTKEIC